jgi:UDP-N-acetylenolpyruvoylglucosamine reductase
MVRRSFAIAAQCPHLVQDQRAQCGLFGAGSNLLLTSKSVPMAVAACRDISERDLYPYWLRSVHMQQPLVEATPIEAWGKECISRN